MQFKILIVDDEEQLTYYLEQTLLVEIPGSRVDVGHSGEEGLSRLADCVYDLIIADLRMPGFSGLELIKGVRYLDGNVPIILMTGYGSDATRQEAEAMGVSYYLEKPFDMDDLLEVVFQILPNEDKR